MSKRVTICFALLLTSILTTLVLWHPFRGTRSISLDQRLSDSIQKAVFQNDLAAGQAVAGAFNGSDSHRRAHIEEECVRQVLQGLNSRDNLLWKPYNSLQKQVPPSLTSFLKPWQEPRRTRQAAASALFLLHSTRVDTLHSTRVDILSPRNCQRVSAVLLTLAKSDPDPAVRGAAFAALGGVGTYSDEIFRMMFDALGHPNLRDRETANRWFARNTVAADQVVPLLLRGLEDEAMRSSYADALRAYGPKASFVVEPLIMLARTNNPATSSVAKWALEGIDLEAFKKAGIEW